MNLLSRAKSNKGAYLTALLVLFVAVFGFSGGAFAQSVSDGIAGQGANIKAQANGFIGIAKLIFIVLGFLSFGGGILLISKDNKQPNQGHLKNGIIAMIVGSLCMMLSWAIGVVTGTINGGEATNAVDATAGQKF